MSFLWIAMLDRDAGTLNAMLSTPGTAWLLEHPMLSIIVFNTWRGTAFSMLLFSAALGERAAARSWRRRGWWARRAGRSCGTWCSPTSGATC